MGNWKTSRPEGGVHYCHNKKFKLDRGDGRSEQTNCSTISQCLPA